MPRPRRAVAGQRFRPDANSYPQAMFINVGSIAGPEHKVMAAGHW